MSKATKIEKGAGEGEEKTVEEEEGEEEEEEEEEEVVVVGVGCPLFTKKLHWSISFISIAI